MGRDGDKRERVSIPHLETMLSVTEKREETDIQGISF